MPITGFDADRCQRRKQHRRYGEYLGPSDFKRNWRKNRKPVRLWRVMKSIEVRRISVEAVRSKPFWGRSGVWAKRMGRKNEWGFNGSHFTRSLRA